MARTSKAGTQETRRRIEAAALALFTTQGFHGTNNREIARRAGVSPAAIYTHYPSKEAIFVSLVETHRMRLDETVSEIVERLTEPLSPPELEAFARAVYDKVRDEPEYFLLMFIDVVEFGNRHFRASLEDLPGRFRHWLGPAFDRAKRQPGWCGQDPAFVLAGLFLYFVHYAVVETQMRGRKHLGLSHEAAIRRIVALISRGLWPGTAAAAKPGDARARLFDEAAWDRIEFARLLSGRLWSSAPEMGASGSRRKMRERLAKVPMPFLPEIARKPPDENQLRIEAAALQLFTEHGFHGTNIHDIAEKAGVSQGTIYLYYESKEKLFEALVEIYRACMRDFSGRIVAGLGEPFSRGDLCMLARAVRAMVYDDAAYWLLLFIDVLEFKNRHFVDLFDDVPAQFRQLLGPVFAEVKRQPGWCGEDPAFVLAVIYLFFFAYFVSERHLQAGRHLGVAEEEAVERFIDLFSRGLWRDTAEKHSIGEKRIAGGNGSRRAARRVVL